MNYLSRARNFRTKKKLGQNFLIDANAIQRIIDEANIQPDETIIEIGAGVGFVTEQIAPKAKRIIAIEIDFDAIEELISLPYSNIDVIGKDILKTDISELTDEQVKIIANIPYYITSPILVHLLGEIDQDDYPNRKKIKEIILMVQYEVAKRIVANEKSPSKEYGLLSILVNYWAETELLQKVPARSFYPSPKVDSALVKLTLRDRPAIDVKDPKLFRRVIRASFNVRRKTLKNALCMGGFKVETVIKALELSNIEPNRRAESLSMEDFKNLTEVLTSIEKGNQ